MKKKTNDSVKVKTKKTPLFLEVRCVGRKYEAEGETFEDVVSKIAIPNGSHAMSVLTLTSENGVKERIINGRQTHGLFGTVSPTMRAIFLKTVKSLFI